ncbi:asparagine synthase (glutamine-hydrolyzing) [bacterium]|nr:asparagine synthase (glutamine-hydrolyzing) [bacterium]
MCGIAGQYLFDEEAQVDQALLQSMIDRLRHRGPEAVGLWVDGNVGLTHARLKLLDPEHGTQPMHGKNGSVLSYVGEIYNNTELRAELTIHGYPFQHSSDTEVLLAAYETWGENAWPRLNGMFAFALSDALNRKLHLVRDHVGIKPMFYRIADSGIEFSSEPAGWISDASLHPAKPEALIHFLRFAHSVKGPDTLFKGIHALEPGQLLTVSHAGSSLKRWHVQQKVEQAVDDPIQLTAKLRHLLHLSVGRQMVADAPAGVMLSGGVDSSILTGLLSQMQPEPVHTYAVALEGDEADLEAARNVARKFRTRHQSIVVSPSEFFRGMDELMEIRKLPVALPNEVLIYLLSKRAANDVKCLLSGEGADELFGGYSRVLDQILRFEEAQRKASAGDPLPLKALRLENPTLDFSSEARFFESCYSWFTPNELLDLLNPEWHSLVRESSEQCHADSFLNEAAAIDYEQRFFGLLLNYHLPHLLQRLDGATMAASIEGRVPFLDHALMDFVRSIPMKLKYRTGAQGKELLRRAFADLIGDRAAARVKKAFHASPSLLFESEEGRKRLNNMMADLQNDRLFNPDGVLRLLNQNRGQQDYLGVWLLYSLAMWQNRNTL